jgi:signal transduction histidine kinase
MPSYRRLCARRRCSARCAPRPGPAADPPVPRRPPAARRDLERLVGTTRRLGEIVDDLLLSARLAADPDDQPTREPVDLTALTRDAVSIEAARAAEQGVTLNLTTPNGSRALCVALRYSVAVTDGHYRLYLTWRCNV